MKKINSKGFTLVELLAVIVILAIILAIAVPSITGIISSAKTGAFESDAKMLVTGVEYKVLELSTTGGTPLVLSAVNAKETADDYGGDPANYDQFWITDLDPITICVITAPASEFGAQSAIITKTSIETFTSPATCPTGE